MKINEIARMKKAGTEYKLEVNIYFLTDEQWENETLWVIENYYYEPEYELYIRNEARGFSYENDIYIKASAKNDFDFSRLLLHELGHAVCGFDDTARKGDIMNSNYRYRWGCEK